MRIWSIHPKYLDSKGLVALWRETLLAKNALEGKTKGYKNHPQLYRFKTQENSMDCINQYLSDVYYEAKNRGYNFNKEKVNWKFKPTTLKVTNEQINYERIHFLNKLKVRDSAKYSQLINEQIFDTHPIFKVVNGGIEDWEIV